MKVTNIKMPSIDIFVEMANYFVILTNFNKS